MMFLNSHFIRNTFMAVPTPNLMLQYCRCMFSLCFWQEIHVGNYGSWICGRKVSAYFVGLTICFLFEIQTMMDQILAFARKAQYQPGKIFNSESIFNSFAFDRTWWCKWEYCCLLFLLIGIFIIDIHLLLVYYWSLFYLWVLSSWLILLQLLEIPSDVLYGLMADLCNYSVFSSR